MLDAVLPPAPSRTPKLADLDRVLHHIADAAQARDIVPGADLRAETEWLHDAGLLVGALPFAMTQQPGWSDDPPAIADLLRRIGAASLPLGRLFEGHVNAAQLIALYGSPTLRVRIAAQVAAGAVLGVWGADSDDPVTATATAGGSFAISGTKAFCSGLGLVSTALVSAQLAGQIALFAIDATDPARGDPAAWRVSGMRATMSGNYRFDGIAAAGSDLVGPPDSYYAEPYFLGGMYRICAVQLGGLEALLAAFIATLRRRNRAASALARHRTGLVACQVATAQAVTADMARRVAQAANFEDIAHRSILAREAVESCVVEALRLVERGAGTEAHREPTNLSRIRRDLALYIRQAAVDERLDMVGAALLAGTARIHAPKRAT